MDCGFLWRYYSDRFLPSPPNNNLFFYALVNLDPITILYKMKELHLVIRLTVTRCQILFDSSIMNRGPVTTDQHIVKIQLGNFRR